MKCKIENGKLITQLPYVRIPFYILNFTFYILLAAPAAASTPPLCKVGTVANLVQSGSTWTWTCEGIHGGKSKSCAPKINGACGSANNVAAYTAPDADLCSSGNATTVSEENNTFKWSCDGINGGNSVTTCSAPRIVNGVCGSDNGKELSSAPTNLCSAGTAGSVSGSGPWTWECTGVNEGSNASCSATKPTCVNDTVPTQAQAYTSPMGLVQGYCHNSNTDTLSSSVNGTYWNGSTGGVPGGGVYCWCRTKSYGTNQCGALSSWVFVGYDYFVGVGSSCATNCAHACARNVSSWGGAARW
ncbi:MAG: hypothetical protein FWE93_05170 [Alphaproteobacteria bacterium]|nr:hypothetical protein [Alphaproteobacteria bacterium]